MIPVPNFYLDPQLADSVKTSGEFEGEMTDKKRWATAHAWLEYHVQQMDANELRSVIDDLCCKVSSKDIEDIFQVEMDRDFYFYELNELEVEPDKEWTDVELEVLWDELGNVCVDNEECIDNNWKWWRLGTHREVIWKWIDERHSKGVGWLMNERE